MSGLRSTIKALGITSREFSGLQRVRGDMEKLNGTLAAQQAELVKTQAKLTDQRAAYAALDHDIDRARASVEKATAAHASSRQELDRERAAVQSSRLGTAEQAADFDRLRKAISEASAERKRADGYARSAQGTLDGRRQYLSTLQSGTLTKESHLGALTSAGAPAAEIARAARELDQQRLKAQEVGDAMHIYESAVHDSAAAAQVAAAHLNRLTGEMAEQKAAAGALAKEQQKRLGGFEEGIRKSSDALDASRKAEKDATEAKRAHHKEAAQQKQSLEHLEKQEEQHGAAVRVTENQIKHATETNEKYTESLEKKGHRLGDVTESQRLHGLSAARAEAKLRHQEEMKQLRDRSRDLRSQAMSHLYFTIGSGFLFTAPIKEAVEFEKAMIRVKAMSGANAEEFKGLKEQARTLGASTIYTAKEVAEAQNELATAGYRTGDIITAMPSLLALAESSMTSLARTAEITSEVLQGFNIDVSEMARVGDSLTAAYSGSASSLESLGEMLKYVAASSVDVGSSLEQTLAASSVLHNSGVKGSMAGTAMRSIFLRLVKPPKELQKELDRMNISNKDKDGNVRDWMEIIRDINASLQGVGTAKKAAVSKALAGEEHAPSASILLRSQKDGSLKLMQRTFELSPAFNGMAKSLLAIPDADLRTAADKLGIKFNRAMSGGGIAAAMAGSLKGLKGSAAEAQMQKIFSELKLKPKPEDMKPEEFVGDGKGVDAALKRLNIRRNKALGGSKSSDELTQEIKTQMQTLPVEEKLKYIEIFFSRTRTGVADLMMEFARSGKNFDQLLKALNEAQTMEKTKKELSKSTAHDLEEIQGGINDILITFGEAFIPVLKDMMATIKPMLDSLGKWLQAHQGVAKAIMLGVGGLFAFSAGMALLKFSLSGVLDLVRAGKTGAGWVGPGTAGRAGAGWLRTGLGIGKNFAMDAAGSLWGGSKSGLKSAGKWGGRVLKAGAKGGWKGLLKTGPLLRGSLGMIGSGARAAGVALMGLGPIGWGIAAAVTAVALGGYLIWKNWGTIGPKLQKLWTGIRLSVGEAWTSIANGIGAAWDWVVQKLSAPGWLQDLWGKFTGFFRSMYEAVKPYLKAMLPWIDTAADGIKAAPGWLSKTWDSGKKELSGMFSMPDGVNVPSSVERAASGSTPITQRNVITVNANITVAGGNAAPAQVASKIKSEIQSAFRNVPSFSFLDPVEVS